MMKKFRTWWTQRRCGHPYMSFLMPYAHHWRCPECGAEGTNP